MNTKVVAGLVVGVAIGVGLGLAAQRYDWLMENNGLATAETDATEKRILYWVAPMDANYRRDEPGKSPMGMDLIPVYEGEESGDGEDGPAIKISPTIVNNIGVRTTRVKREDLRRRIDTVGYIGYDETKVSHVHLRVSGWVEDLIVDYTGKRVRKGERLLRVFSPTLISAQSEYLLALKGGRQPLITSARNNLRSLGVSDGQIKTLSRQSAAYQLINVEASQDGIVSELHISEGMYVQPATTVLTIADLASVWLLADVFEDQSQWVREGQPARMRLPYIPGRVWEGVVDYVYPTIDPKTRTLKVRLRFANPGEELKPNMYAEVTLFGVARENALAIPREALIRTGTSERVIVDLGKGRFRPVEVTAGIESGQYVEILSGLSEADKVVVSGQFLIDSESSLSASFQRLYGPPAPEEDQDDVIVVSGVVNAVMPKTNKVNITHEPVPALGWPAMTMDFKVLDSAQTQELAQGASVRFDLAVGPDGLYAISRIESTGQ